MARRSDHSPEELREMTLAAAIRIVDTEGFRALTARNVARAIGYTPGTLYNLFANLDDLAVHLNGNTLDRLYDLLVRAETIGEPETDLRTLLTVYFKFFEMAVRSGGSLFTATPARVRFVRKWAKDFRRGRKKEGVLECGRSEFYLLCWRRC